MGAIRDDGEPSRGHQARGEFNLEDPSISRGLARIQAFAWPEDASFVESRTPPAWWRTETRSCRYSSSKRQSSIRAQLPDAASGLSISSGSSRPSARGIPCRLRDGPFLGLSVQLRPEEFQLGPELGDLERIELPVLLEHDLLTFEHDRGSLSIRAPLSGSAQRLADSRQPPVCMARDFKRSWASWRARRRSRTAHWAVMAATTTAASAVAKKIAAETSASDAPRMVGLAISMVNA